SFLFESWIVCARSTHLSFHLRIFLDALAQFGELGFHPGLGEKLPNTDSNDNSEESRAHQNLFDGTRVFHPGRGLPFCPLDLLRNSRIAQALRIKIYKRY